MASIQPWQEEVMWALCVWVVLFVVVVVVVDLRVGGAPYQVKGQGVLVEGVHVWEAGLHLGLDVAFFSSCKPDPSDPLKREGRSSKTVAIETDWKRLPLAIDLKT